MADWSDEETNTATGRSFGGNDIEPQNDDGWGDEPPKKFGNDRNNGRGRGGRGGRGGGRGGGRSYDDNGEGGFQRRGGGRFNRDNDNDEETGGVNQNMENKEFSKVLPILPQDYRQETIEKFMKDLPQLQKSANLIEMYCIDSYLTKAFNIHLEKDPHKESQSSKVDSEKQQNSIFAEQREEFMHNLKAVGRQKESILSTERHAQIQKERSKLAENFWHKKFEREPGLREMLQDYCKLKENRNREGFSNLLNELQSDNYEISADDLVQADNRRVGLSKDNNEPNQIVSAQKTRNEKQQCQKTLRSSMRESPQHYMSQQSPSARQRIRNQSSRRVTPSESSINFKTPLRKNLPEKFMQLRLPYKTIEIPTIPTKKPTSSKALPPLFSYYKVNNYFETFHYERPNYEELSSIRDVARRNVAPLTTSQSITSMHTPLAASSIANQQLVSYSMDNFPLVDLPMHQTDLEPINLDTNVQRTIAAESTPKELRPLPPNIDPIDCSPVSPIIPANSIGINEQMTLRRREGICRLPAIIERRTESLANQILHHTAENVINNDATNFDVVGNTSLDRPQALFENVEHSIEEVRPRNWGEILRSQNTQINYIIRGNQGRHRQRRRRHRRRAQNLEEPWLAPVDNLPIIPSPPIPYEVGNLLNEQEQLAQINHEQFLIDNIDSIGLLMDNEYVFHKMMIEYMQIYQGSENNSTGGFLLSGMGYDAKDVLEMNSRELEVKVRFFEELVKNPFINIYRLTGIQNQEDIAFVIGLLMDLNDYDSENRNNRGNRGGRGGRDGGRGRNGDRNGNDDEEGGEPQKPREFYIPPEPTENEEEMFATGITSGLNFNKYDNIPVKISGSEAPESISTFEDAGFRDLIWENVKKSGYKIPTPIQKTAIPAIMASRDLMACAQTGSGKTAAYLLPIINSLLTESAEMIIGRPLALIVAPTRELAIQIYNEARKFAHGSYLKISIVYGGTSSKHQSESVAKGCHILIATPGRLLDFVDRAYITFEEIRFVVLDEADRMLDLGFKSSVDRIMSHSTMREQTARQSLMFSATFPEDIQLLASNYLRDYVFVTIGIIGGACADVKQTIIEVQKFDKRGKLMELLQENADGTIVFVDTKRNADFLASLLSETEYPTTSIHGDRLQRQREEALKDFRNGRMKVLVATSVAARGLDIPNVKHVVNYDMPDSLDEYVHRIGRTGRVGNDGRATSFFDPDKDSALASGLIKILEGSGQEVPSFLHNYGCGGGDEPRSNNFGGRDMRQYKNHTEKPAPLEEEEDWG